MSQSNDTGYQIGLLAILYYFRNYFTIIKSWRKLKAAILIGPQFCIDLASLWERTQKPYIRKDQIYITNMLTCWWGQAQRTAHKSNHLSENILKEQARLRRKASKTNSNSFFFFFFFIRQFNIINHHLMCYRHTLPFPNYLLPSLQTLIRQGRRMAVRYK